LKEARGWYGTIRPELADRFSLAVEATVHAISETPLQFPIVYKTWRRALLHRFPYLLFFNIEKDRIMVHACFHGKRNPKRWQAR